MSASPSDDLSNFSMLDLFRVEAETQSVVLSSGLLELEGAPTAPGKLEALMRAAHSLKGAARIVNFDAAVRVAHALEDCLVAAQKGRILLNRGHIDLLLDGVDLLTRISRTPENEVAKWSGAEKGAVDSFLGSLARVVEKPDSATPPRPPVVPAAEPTDAALAALAAAPDQPQTSPSPASPASSPASASPSAAASRSLSPSPALPPPVPPTARPGADRPGATRATLAPSAAPAPAAAAPPAPGASAGTTGSAAPASSPPSPPKPARETADRVLRVTADNLNRLLGLAGESLVESRWLTPFTESLLRLKRLQTDLGKSMAQLRDQAREGGVEEDFHTGLALAQLKLAECQQFLADRLVELDTFDRRSSNLSHRLYHEALSVRMRPFADGLHGLARMVRDVSRSLGKEVRLEVIGEMTQVDRDILDRLEAPLTHLLRNAVDHGMESPAERQALGKPATGTVRLEARHSAGMLQITVSDDGRGVDLDRLREIVVHKHLTNAQTAIALSEAELLEFLFLPGFSTKDQVSEVSGRGVGLDVVQSMVKGVRGTIRVHSQAGKGTRFQLQLPLTLSVMRTLLVEIADEPYAFPLAYLRRTLKLPRPRVQVTEGRQYFELDGRNIALVTAHQLFDRPAPKPAGEEWSIVVIGTAEHSYGVIVDRFLGERELVVQPLDPRLGKLKDVSAGALMEEGSPVLIVDVEDLARSIERMVSLGQLVKVEESAAGGRASRRKRVLVVDDSLTVRELERKLLTNHGYEVELAVDGMDGWNAVRNGDFQLVISDVDMPRMDGIELVTQIKQDARLKSMPTLIVSYKDHEEDRRRGLQAGADYYLTKGSFHDDTLIRAVTDLIGEAAA